MRVIHVITRLIVGGAQENTIASVVGLRDTYGVETSLITGASFGPEGSLESSLSGDPGFVTVVPELVRAISPWHDILALRHLAKSFRDRKPDIVHTHSGKAGILGRLAAARARVPIIVHTIHGPSFGTFQGAIPNMVFRHAERRAGRVTTHFVAVADAMTELYLAAGIGKREQYTKILSGFNLKPFLSAVNAPRQRRKLGFNADDFVIGKIARLFKLKGHDDLFAVAPDLLREYPKTKFLLVGDGPWRERFENQARALGLERHFVFTGLVKPSEVPALVGVMDALVHLSRREGLPRALPQALAAGRPVVAYNCDGAREVCVDNETGFLLPPGDLSGLKNRLLRLARDPALRERLGGRGRQFVEPLFDQERMVGQLYQLYQRLMT